MHIEGILTGSFFWYRLVAKNKQICATSEGYATPSNMRRAARRVAKALNIAFVDTTSKK